MLTVHMLALAAPVRAKRATSNFHPGSLSTFPLKATDVHPSESPCSRRSRQGHRPVTTGRGSSSPRCSPRDWWRRAITSRCSPRQTRSPRPACTQPHRPAGPRTRRSTPRSQSACTVAARCSSVPASSTTSSAKPVFDSLHQRTARLVTTPVVTTIHGSPRPDHPCL